MTGPTCPTHGTPLVMFCPRCRGSAGGAVSTPAKRKAARVNVLKTPNLKLKKKRTPKAP